MTGKRSRIAVTSALVLADRNSEARALEAGGIGGDAGVSAPMSTEGRSRGSAARSSAVGSCCYAPPPSHFL